MKRQTSLFQVLMPSSGIGLRRWLRQLKCLELAASFINRGQRRIRRHVNLETACIENLRNEAAVGHRRGIAKTETSALRTRCKLLLQRRETKLDPMLYPFLLDLIAHTQLLFEHAQVVERMDITGDCQGNLAHMCAIQQARRQQRRCREAFFQVLQHRQRLRDVTPILFHHRHQRLWIQGAECRCKLFAAIVEQVHRHGIVGLAFQIQRDAYPIRCRTAKVAVKMNRHAFVSLVFLYGNHHTERAGNTVPATSPKPMRGKPSRSAQPRMMTVSPSSIKMRVSPLARLMDCLPPAVSSSSDPADSGVGPDKVPEPNKSPARRLQPPTV